VCVLVCVCVCWGWGRCDYKTSAIYSTCTRTSTKIQTQKVNSKSQRVLCEYVYVVHAQYNVCTKVLSTFVLGLCRARFFRFFFPAPSELLRFFGQLEANRGELDSLRSTDRRGMRLAVSR